MIHVPLPAAHAAPPGKSHYLLLDGLRGVAALMVVAFHLFEAHAGGDPQRQIINHGYLAVDFFFLLSGFVVAYAYDDRWAGMSVGDFFRRRLIRLQPMMVMGSLIGAALFVFQDYAIYPRAGSASFGHVVAVMLLGFAMIPLPRSGDIRGWGELYPLNGAAWSLLYEYVANALHAAGLRKLSNRALGVLVAIAAAALLYLAVLGPRGDLVGGWTLDAAGVRIGLTRVMFPFFAGVLLMRLGGAVRIPYAFTISSLLLVIALALPRFGGTTHPWLNGLYEAACIILLFPLIVAIGAGAGTASGASMRIATFFGRLSYPLYITHTPLIYIYVGWVAERRPSPVESIVAGVGLFLAAVAIAWACLKLYDEPVRRRLAARFLPRRAWPHSSSA